MVESKFTTYVNNTKKLFDISHIKRISFRKDINGLRAIAVLAVVFYHADFELFKGGWLGVDIFFVISGYLISNIIISELNEGTFSFKNFYLRRIKRILPALFSTLLLTIPFAYWLLTPKAMNEYVDSVLSSLFFYANYYFRNLDFYAAESTKVMPLLHTWSLAIEEQFYLIFPLFCFVIFKYLKKYFIIFLSIFFLVSFFLNSLTNDFDKFYYIQFRGWELIFGSLIMFVNQKLNIKHLNYLGLVLISFSFLYFDDTMLSLNSIEPRLVSTLGVGMVLLSDQNNRSNLLSNKLFNFIGLSSFSIYLFHQPIFAFLRLFQDRYSDIDQGLLLVGLLLGLFFFPYLNWKYVELYFQSKQTGNFLVILFSCLVIFSLFIYGSNTSDGYKERYDFVPEEVLYYSRNVIVSPDLEDNSDYLFPNRSCDYDLDTVTYCVWFDKKSENTIYLIGDSQVDALSASFLNNLKLEKGSYNLVFMPGRAGRCILSQQSDTPGETKECSEKYFNTFIDLIDEEKDIVIAFGRFNIWLEEKGKNEVKCTECDPIKVFSNRLNTISNTASKFILIEPIPTYSFNIANSYLYKKTTWGDEITIDLNEWLKKIEPTNNFLRNLDQTNIEFLPTIPIFCGIEITNKCYASTTNKLYYSDSNHLTLDGADLITNQLIRYLLPKK
jgi:peptidoglycan/LPS O-acetylase OafA/YrhL